MELSIVIVNWNTRELLAKCLESIRSCPPVGEYEVWVVDNASTDASVEMVREQFPEVRLIDNDQNMGFARANNQAIGQSRGRYVLLLNPDTEVKQGALEKLVKFMDTHPQAGAAGARLLNSDGSLQISCHPMPTLSREFWRMFYLDAVWPYASYSMEKWSLDQPRDVGVLMGACIILPRQLLELIGLMDKDYFMYSEEVDLCYRVQKLGRRIYWLPQAEVIHHRGKSAGQVPAETFLRLYAGKILYFRKHHGWFTVQVYKLILLFAALSRLILTPLAILSKPTKRERHLRLSNHYRRLLTQLPGM